jgi:hypothetical protein
MDLTASFKVVHSVHCSDQCSQFTETTKSPAQPTYVEPYKKLNCLLTCLTLF